MYRLLLVIALLSLLVIPAAASPNGWTEPPLSASPPARYGHTMVNLNGEIYVFGGRTGDAQTAGSEPMGMVLNDLWRLNGEQARWEEQQAQNPPSARYNHATVVYDGKMYVFFGKDASGADLIDVFEYDPATKLWTLKKAAAPAAPRANAAAVTPIMSTLDSPGIGIFGGETAVGASREAWFYKPWEDRPQLAWKQAPDMPYALADPTAVYFAPKYWQDHIYVYGDDHLLKYDINFETWTELHPPTMPPAREGHTVVTDFYKGTMIISGGRDPTTGGELRDSWEYNVADNTWKRLEDLTIPLTESAAAMLYSSTGLASSQQGTSKMVVFGGLSNGVPTDRTFLYTRTHPIYLPLVIRALTAP